jgi:hypothetical protein
VADDRQLDRTKFLGVAAAGAATVGGLGFAGYARAKGRPETAAAIQAAKPFLIGCPFPLHSFYAADGNQMKNGSGLAIDEINSSGGIAGRKIDRIVIDARTSRLPRASPPRSSSFPPRSTPSSSAISGGRAELRHRGRLRRLVHPRQHPRRGFSASGESSEVLQHLQRRLDRGPTDQLPLYLARLASSGQFKPRAKTIHFIRRLGTARTSQGGPDSVPEGGWNVVGVERSSPRPATGLR